MTPIDLSSANFIANPYPSYQTLREKNAVYECPETGYYYTANYAQVRQFFKHPALSSNRISTLTQQLPEPMRDYAQPIIDCLGKWILFQDPPFHTQVRRIINPAFSSAVTQSLTPQIHQVTKQLMTFCGDDFDLIQALAYPLPVIIISELLGVPAEDRDKIRLWSDRIAEFLGGKTDLTRLAQVRQSLVEATDYFNFIVQQQKEKPTSALLSQLFKLQQQEHAFSDDHLVANVIALIFAGHETTTNGIANAILAALRFPEQAPSAIEHESELQSWVDESLRWESPVQRMGRLIVDDILLDNQSLKQGRRIFLLIGGANHDPTVFTEPEKFNPMRSNVTQHLAFGYGPHFCSGAQLARTEIAIALFYFLQKFKPQDCSIQQLAWRQNLALRGPLPFQITAAGSCR